MTEIFRRVRAMSDADGLKAEGQISMLASTDDAVSWGGWREILSHKDGAIDVSAARSLLVNHDPDQLAGGIHEMASDGRALMSKAEIDEDARMKSGVSVRKMVSKGRLRGVSIGYTYDQKDTSWNEEERTLTVHKWRLLEISLTPIPADARAHVRSLPFEVASQPAAPAASQKESAMPDNSNAAGSNAAAGDEKARALEIETLRAERDAAKRESALRARAQEHGIDVKDVDFSSFKSEADGLNELLKRKAAKVATPEPEKSVVQVVRDGADKWMEGAQKGLMGERDGLFMSNEQIIRRCAAIDGEREQEMSFSDLISLSLRRMSFGRNAANKTVSSFSNLLGNTANKMLLNGFDAYESIADIICTIKDAKDFNTHYHVAAATGRLQETNENEAAPELVQKEGSYSTAMKMWMATLSITEQALINDSMAEIMRSFYKTGYIAGRTIDREVFNKLLNATWTNDNTASAPIGTAGNVDKVRADFKKKKSPAGEKMELDPAIIVVDPLKRYDAEVATGQLYGINAGAGNSQTGSNAIRGLRVVDSTFVGDTALYSSALTTDYFLFGNPKLVDTVTLEFLNGQRVPVIEPFDPGAVAAVKMKIKLPFVATVATHTDSAGNARVSGIQRAQA